MSSTNPQIKSRADALAVGLSGAGAVVNKVAATSFPYTVLDTVNAIFTTTPVTDSLVSAVETLTANSGILEIAISEAQDAISTVSAAKWQSGIWIGNGTLSGTANYYDGNYNPYSVEYGLTTNTVDLLLNGVVQATVPFVVQESRAGNPSDGVLGDTYDVIVIEYGKTVAFDQIQFTGVSNALALGGARWHPTDHYWLYPVDTNSSQAVNRNVSGTNLATNPRFAISSAFLAADAQTV
jgi:hypothetical protein